MTEQSSGDTPDEVDHEPSIDLDRLRATLRDHPVRLAVLFGSRADGSADATSDVDLVVELDAVVDDRGRAKVELLTALSIALDRNDIDLSLVSEIDPAVGAAAFSNGKLLCGSRERFEALGRRFDDERSDGDASLRERFDQTLANVDRLVEEGT